MSSSRRKGPAPRTPDTAPVRTDAPFLRYALAIFAVAAGVRLVHVWLLSRSPFFDALMGDARGYDDWARRIAGGEWIGTEVFYQAPLYPYFLGVLFKVFGHSLLAVRIVQAMVGAGSCALIGLAGYRLFSVRVGAIAGFALAVYAPAIFFDALIQKSVLDLFFIALSLWLIGRLVDDPRNVREWFALGLAMGGLSLTRENALVFVVVIVGWALVNGYVRLKPDATQLALSPPQLAGRANVGSGPSRTLSFRDRVRFAATFIGGLAIVLMPVAIRNYAVGGGFYLTTSQFGPNFFIGNNPQADGTYMSLRFGRGAPEYERTDATELAEHAVGRTLTPAEVSSYWTSRALGFIEQQPGAWLQLMARKIALLFNATEMLDTEAQESHADWSWPLRVGGVFGHLGVLVPLAAAGLVLAWRDRSRLAVLYVMLAVYAASVVMFYVFARYRLPLVPMLLLFAAAAASALPAWIRSASSRARLALALLVAAAAIFSNWPLLSKPLMKAITETNLAVALQSDGRNDEAAVHYRRAIEIQADYAPAYNNLGVLQRATGQVDEAIATYEQALSLKGDYPDAHYNLANALLEKNKPGEAAEHFRIALRSIPDSAGAANNLGIALAAEHKPADAVAAFRAAVAADPNSAVAHRNLADALASVGQIDEAVAEFHRATTLDPKDANAQYNLGVVLLQNGRNSEAVAALRLAVAQAPQSVEAHNNLGIALGSSGDLDAAIAQFRQALAIDASSSEARRNLEMAEQARADIRSRPR
jgi:tetratricopeptide (TPR) repeat protein